MLTYQVRERIYRHPENESFVFPNRISLLFVFQPLQPFGKAPGGGRTAIRAVTTTVCFNNNKGHYYVESEKPLHALEVTIKDPKITMKLRGNKLYIDTYCNELRELDELVQSIFFGFPMLLNVEFADPPVVERVEGKVGDVSFSWELTNWRMPIETTTQQLQQERVDQSWSRFNLIGLSGNRRLIAALHYFHVACRLCRVGDSPWEFMSEVILNLAKILEVLFPPTGDGKTIEAARSGLAELEYSATEIDKYFIPAICLRNQIDSAHVDLSLFTRTQLRILHAYTESAEIVFRSMLRKLLNRMESGQYTLTQYSNQGRRRKAEVIINKLAQYYSSDHGG